MKRRIAVLMTGAFATTGGVQLVNRNIARALANHAALCADFFSLVDTEPDPRYVSPECFQGFNGNRSRFVGGVIQALRARNYSALLVTHRNLFPLALYWKFTVGRPYVLFAHGIEIWDRQSVLYRRALLDAQTVLANSRFTLQRMCSANGLPETQAQVVPLCLDEIGLSEATSSEANPDAPILLTVARSLKGEAYKGQDTVIRALPQILRDFPHARYVLAGGGDDQLRLRQLAESLGVAGQVEFLGRISDEERNGLFRKASVFVMPSRGEGFGVVYLEAMHYRLPCIAGNGDGGREVVRNGLNGFTVDPGNPEEVGVAVIRFLSEPARRTAMGDAGYALCHSEYSFANFSQRIGAVLEGAAA